MSYSNNETTEPGLPVERTTLAWLRTTLAFMVGAIIMTRLLAQQHTLVALGHAVLTLPLGSIVTILAWHRHLRHERGMRTEAPLPDARLPIAVAVLAGFVGISGIVYVLIRA